MVVVFVGIAVKVDRTNFENVVHVSATIEMKTIPEIFSAWFLA